MIPGCFPRPERAAAILSCLCCLATPAPANTGLPGSSLIASSPTGIAPVPVPARSAGPLSDGSPTVSPGPEALLPDVLAPEPGTGPRALGDMPGARPLLAGQPARVIMNSAAGPLLRPGALALLPESSPAAAPATLPEDATLEERMEAGISSLFADRARGGFFAPLPPRPRNTGRNGGTEFGGPFIPAGPEITMLRHLIASAEAGRAGYDAVQHAATRRPARRPTAMTLGEIYDWIEATPGQHHAIGRYQFIPATLRRLAAQTGAGRQARFTPALQDRFADLLLEEAGLSSFRAGQLSRHGFMNNLARIWAGLPTSSGRSYYEGYAGNSAVISWARFDAEMARIFRA